MVKASLFLLDYGHTFSRLEASLRVDFYDFFCSFCCLHAQQSARTIHDWRAGHHCDTCFKSYKNKSTLYRHKKHECNQNPYQCFYCGKFYRQKYDLKLHVYKKHPDDAKEFDKLYKDLHLFKTPLSNAAVKGLNSVQQGDSL